MSRTKKPRPATYDIEYVRAAAARQWPAILTTIAGVDPDLLDGQHHACPKCGGTDRFRLIDAEAGALLCNQCFSSNNGDGFAALQWITGKKFVEVLTMVAEHLGIQPSEPSRISKGAAPKPDEHLAFEEWDAGNDMLAAAWCLWKEPIELAAIKAVGGRVARYRQQYMVLALPVWGKQLDAAPPVGWIIYSLAGGNLPKYAKNNATGKWEISEWVKVKLTAGSQPGVVTDLARLRSARVAIKVEGPSDLLGVLSLADLPDDHAALTNANGAGERPADWMLDLFASKDAAWTVHDADHPGQAGAIGKTDEKNGQFRPGWANYIADRIPVKNVVLPFEIVETHGKDLRDFLNMPSTFADLQALAAAAEQLSGGAKIGSTVLEAEDDPHRLARVNLDNYAKLTAGGTLRYWRDEWYTWKPDRACYQRILFNELRAKIGASVKQEFDRLNLVEQKETESGELPTARKVTTNLVTNVLNATAGMQIVPNSVEPMTWLSDNGERSQHNFVAMQNGIIDLDRLLADDDECILPHSPNWFSTVCLPYNFDPTARCPQWEAFLEKSLENDTDRINILQEWAGYCLMPDTSQQKFLAMEGEGGNGKSVFMAGLQAIVGPRNCSNIGLECLAQNEYDASETYGKLVNICADVGEIDKISEGNLKSFTSGDVMSFRRKFLGVLTVKPTARLVLAFNKRPRFHDPTDGVWRRMLLVPWLIRISEEDRVYGMDSIDWWNRSGELPGMFNWALRGLFRLRYQGKFTESKLVTEAVADYKDEANPAQVFLKENFEANDTNCVESAAVYAFYVKWAEKNGYRLMNERTFGKEVKRVFPKSVRTKSGTRISRYYVYQGIAFSQEEICGEKTSDATLF